MPETSVERQDRLNRELSYFLQEELAAFVLLRKKVYSMEHFLKTDPEIQQRYQASIQDGTSAESGQPNPQWLAQYTALLEKMRKP